MRRIATTVALALALLLPCAATAEGPGWNEPIILSGDEERYAFDATLTFDTSGAIHVAWEQWSGREGDDAQIFYRTNKGGTWSDAVPVSGDVRPARTPALAADASGTVHLAFAAGSRGASNQIYYAALTPDGAWHGPELVDEVGRKNGAARPTIITDAAGAAHILWMRFRDNGYDVASRTHYPAGGWSELRYVLKDPGFTDRPRGVAIGEQLHVMAKASTPEGDRIAYVQGSGGNWSQPAWLSDGQQAAYAPVLATDGWRLFAAWDYKHDIHFASSEDGGASWVSQGRVDRHKGVATSPAMTTVAGKVLLAWQLHDRLMARTLDLASGQWDTIQQLNASYERNDVKDPELASGPGDQAAVVWSQRNGDTQSFEVLLAQWHP